MAMYYRVKYNFLSLISLYDHIPSPETSPFRSKSYAISDKNLGVTELPDATGQCMTSHAPLTGVLKPIPVAVPVRVPGRCTEAEVRSLVAVPGQVEVREYIN